MKVVTGGNACEVRHGGTVEVLVGETLTVGVEVAYVDGAAEAGVTISGKSMTFSEPGRRRFSDGRFEFHIVACESAIMARLPNGQRTGHGNTDARMLLRSICNHASWPFDGYADQIAGRALAPYGAHQ